MDFDKQKAFYKELDAQRNTPSTYATPAPPEGRLNLIHQQMERIGASLGIVMINARRAADRFLGEEDKLSPSTPRSVPPFAGSGELGQMISRLDGFEIMLEEILREQARMEQV